MPNMLIREEVIDQIKIEMADVLDPVYRPPSSMLVDVLGTPKRTDKSYVKGTSMRGIQDLVEKEEGEDVAEVSAGSGYATYGKMRTFSNKITVTHEALNDDWTGQIESLREFGENWNTSVTRTRDNFWTGHFNRGGLVAGHVMFNQSVGNNILSYSPGNFIYDDKPLFALSGNGHPFKNYGANTKYNHLGGLALTIANLKAAFNLATDTNAYDENGDRITITPNVLMVPTALGLEARQILSSNLLPGSPNNDINPLFGNLRIVVNPYLTDADSWFLIDTTKQGMEFFEREDAGIDVTFNANKLTYTIVCWFRAGVRINNWRPFVASNLVTS